MTAIGHVGDIGTAIIVDTETTLTGATSVSLIIQKPDETVEEWVGSVYEITKILYYTLAGDFDQIGKYYVQARAEGVPQTFITGLRTYFTVKDILDA